MIIGFSGQKGSGKDTAGDRFLAGLKDDHVAKFSFAEKLKISATQLFPGVQRADWEEWKNDDNIKVLIIREGRTVETPDGGLFQGDVLSEQTGREFLQHYGTESHRNVFGQNFWVEQAAKDATGLYNVVTDVRFPNEASFIVESGGIVVRVYGADDVTISLVLDPETGEQYYIDYATGEPIHPSETALLDWPCDFSIDNTVRGDNFAKLDRELEKLAAAFDLPWEKP